MREKLIELANDVLKYLPWGQIGSRTADDIADHLLDNGVIVLPCKVGDTVWFDTYKRGKNIGIQPHKIARVSIVASVERGFAEAGADLYDWQFGKTVFLTREEAEAALKERK